MCNIVPAYRWFRSLSLPADARPAVPWIWIGHEGREVGLLRQERQTRGGGGRGEGGGRDELSHSFPLLSFFLFSFFLSSRLLLGLDGIYLPSEVERLEPVAVGTCCWLRDTGCSHNIAGVK